MPFRPSKRSIRLTNFAVRQKNTVRLKFSAIRLLEAAVRLLLLLHLLDVDERLEALGGLLSTLDED